MAIQRTFLSITDIFRKWRGSAPPDLLDINEKANTLIGYAELARKPLRIFSTDICKASKLDPNASIILGETKFLARIMQKALARYDGDVFRVSDACRDQVLLNMPSDADRIISSLHVDKNKKNWADRGIEIKSIENFLQKPTSSGWRGLVIKVEIDLGKGRKLLGEIQAIPKGMRDAYDQTHVYLEQARELEDLAKAEGRDMTPHELSIVTSHRSESRKIHIDTAAKCGFGHPSDHEQTNKSDLRLVA